jgi:hypothetical protein
MLQVSPKTAAPGEARKLPLAAHSEIGGMVIPRGEKVGSFWDRFTRTKKAAATRAFKWGFFRGFHCGSSCGRATAWQIVE